MNINTVMITVVLSLCLDFSIGKLAEDPIVLGTNAGKVKGRVGKSFGGKIFHAFHQIPYAQPPVGPNRFRRPKQVKSWEGILDCSKNTRVCIQNLPIFGFANTFLSYLPPVSEDCLHLNIYTPINPRYTKNLIPVMVWIHGGAFQVDDLMTYGPEYFMDYGIVVVTINYRLNSLGFLTTNDEIIPPNNGLHDQHLALKWIHKNIQNFGGDPLKITLAGESAGGAAVGHQVLSDKNKGLFRAAIIQSCSPLAPHEYQPDPVKYAFELGKKLYGHKLESSTKLLEVLQQANIADIVKATAQIDNEQNESPIRLWTSNWVPTIEGNSNSSLVKMPMHQALIDGKFNRIPLLIGFNSEESLTFIGTKFRLHQKATEAGEHLDQIVDEKLNVENRKRIGEDLQKIYTKGSFKYDAGAFLKFLSDNGYISPVIRFGELSSKYNDVFLYQFSHKNLFSLSNFLKIDGSEDGVGHFAEIPYMWKLPFISTLEEIDPSNTITRQRLLLMWSNFVKYLDPTPKSQNILKNIKWEKLDSQILNYLNIGDELEMLEGPRHYKEFSDILNRNIMPPLNVY